MITVVPFCGAWRRHRQIQGKSVGFFALAEIHDGGKTKPWLAKRPNSRGVGLPGEAVPLHPGINGRSQPGYSVPSVPNVQWHSAKQFSSLEDSP
tara:strand:- start:93 stop:374 length:282 start_codon:yes stop_codon:yes gene_type:complete